MPMLRGYSASRDVDFWLGLAAGSAVIFLSLFWRYQLHMAGSAEVYGWGLNIATYVFAFGVFVSALIAIRPSMLLAAAPLACIGMTIPQMDGAPFLREYAYGLGFGSLFGIAWQFIHPSANGQFRVASTDLVILGLLAYFLAGVASGALNIKGTADPASRVIVVHVISEIIILSLFFGIVLSLKSVSDVDRLVMALAFAGAGASIAGFCASILPFVISSQVGEFAFFGTHYFCRVQLSFAGPAQYSTFVAAAAPSVVYAATRSEGRPIRYLFLATVWIAPIAVAAGASRPARVAIIFALLLSAIDKRSRVLALGAALFSAVLLAATYQYRCVSDIAAVNAPMLLPAGKQLPNANQIGFTEFVTDVNRSELRAESSAALTAVNEQSRSISLFIFGLGPGLAAYDRFGLGAHTFFLDVLVERGILGGGLLFGVGLVAVWRLLRQLGLDPRLAPLTVTSVASAVPLIAAGIGADIRAWAFVWVYAALVVAVGRIRTPAVVARPQ